ncbi:hypothetical protein CROQUDRAFT_163119 [Cronartium quercuum f. sp. fusiforme G11]|uniref:Uncharacterized protein n=1 Tax=Cronartium quercuum f. sp. fusiforme G11 TaxID=708437 RepID=A0A9P6T949_9BASI|nr:hypothetical protein CROQUDRAFT_163119 [Cronartium quercuum f. sp. fusiforme G11]
MSTSNISTPFLSHEISILMNAVSHDEPLVLHLPPLIIFFCLRQRFPLAEVIGNVEVRTSSSSPDGLQYSKYHSNASDGKCGQQSVFTSHCNNEWSLYSKLPFRQTWRPCSLDMEKSGFEGLFQILATESSSPPLAHFDRLRVGVGLC